MALLFSAVTVTAGYDEAEFTVGGIPREYDRIAAEDDRQLILSTCYGSGKDGRLLIIAEE